MEVSTLDALNAYSTFSAGQNTIRVQLPPKYRQGPNIDYLKVEGLPVSSSPPSFRNPPHFMSLIPDYSSGRISERNLRDAQYETDAECCTLHLRPCYAEILVFQSIPEVHFTMRRSIQSWSVHH